MRIFDSSVPTHFLLTILSFMLKKLPKAKTIIFDLDDTLYDCSGTLVERGRRQTAKTLAQMINCTEDEAYHLQYDVEEKYGVKANIYEKIVSRYHLPPARATELLNEFIRIDVSNISLFPDVTDTLKLLRTQGYRLLLVTSGDSQIQKKKMDVLGLRDAYFNEVLISDRNNGQTKRDCFLDIIRRYSLKAEEIVCVGDKVEDELSAGRTIGMVTVMFEHGRHYNAYRKEPNSPFKPDYSIRHIKELLDT